MKRLIPFLFLATTASASFSGYTYQSTLTVSSANVSNVFGTINNFPVLVSTSMPQISTTVGSGGQLNSSGMDLIFSTMSNCSFNLHWDTETVENVGISTFNAWVNIPVLTTATPTAATFYMCWGNSGITTYQGISTATWDANYVAVYHMNDKAANGVIHDATSNGLNITTVNNTISRSTSSPTGFGLSYLVDADSGTLAHNSNLDLTTQAYTWEAWIYNYSINNNQSFSYFFDTTNGNSGHGWSFDFDNQNTNPAGINVNSNGTAAGGRSSRTSTGGLTPGQWVQMVASLSALGGDVFYGQSSSTINLYFNGVINAANSALFKADASAVPSGFGSDGGNGPLLAAMSEMRFSNGIQRNSDWVQTEYKNQSSPQTFISIGAEQSSAGPVYIPNNFFSLTGGKMTIIGAKVTIQ